MKAVFGAVVGAVLAAGVASAGESPWRAVVVNDGGRYFRETVMTPPKTPVEFTYGGVRHVGLGGGKVLERAVSTKGSETTGRLRVQLDETLVAEIEGAYRAEFGETEWVLWFENPGKVPSKTLSDVVSMRYEFEKCSEATTCPRLRGIRGDHENKYCPYEVDAWNKPNGFSIVGRSRPTHVEFPYFNMYLPTGGVLCAIGWAGNWKADFLNVRDRPRPEWQYHIKFRACPDFASVLLPGERIRNARAVVIPHRGSDIDHVSNLWRAWFRKHNEPKWNAAGEPLRPFTTACFATDTGRPNSDGSISEAFDTWRPTFEKALAEKIVPDFRWFDAGWYFDPRGQTIPSHWYDVGSWELDTKKWPGHSFRESVDAGLSVGMKTLVWFEPERVCDPEALATKYGYRTEWALPLGTCWWRKDKTVAWNNIGDPNCLKWTTDRILGMMDANHIDFYREDHNYDPDEAWKEGDRRAESKLKLPRRGMTETKGVMGHWALWDAIVERGRRTDRCTFVDSCASGGGRNDLESLRRGFPLMRSDADRTTPTLRLSMTASLCRWIPFHGTSTKETEDELSAEDGPGASPYVFRASFLPICNIYAKYVHNPDLDFGLLRRNLAEWRSVADLLLKDFYVLSSWHPENDTGGWSVFAYDDAEKGESVLLAFRRETAPYPCFEAQLKFADPKATYEIVDADSGRITRMSGGELRTRGYLISLPERKSSALLRIRRLQGNPVPADAPALTVRRACSGEEASETAVARTLVSTAEGDGARGHVLVLTKRAPGDCALEVECAVGLPPGPLVWHHDMRSSRQVSAPDGVVRNASRQEDVGTEWLSYWPFAVATGDGGRGRVLALDPDYPAFYNIFLDVKTRRLVLHLDIALTDESPRAEVRFSDYPVEGLSPFRRALAGYYARYPKAFASRVAEHGVWMPFSKISEVKGWEDFGFKFKEGNNEPDWDRAHGILTFLYTEPTTWWHGIAGPTNAYDLAQAAEMTKASGDPLAKAWKDGVFHDRDGRPVGFVKDTPWCKGVVWNYNDAPGIAGETTGWKVKMDHAPRCEYIDSAEMYVTVPLDFRRAHFGGMRTPLCWDARTGRPAVFKGLIGFEYVRAAAEKAHGAGFLTMANGTPMEWFWLAPHLDVLGTEWDWQDWRNGRRVWTPPSDTELIYRRALCGRKPFCFLMNTDFALLTPDRARKYFDRCLAYGAFPGFFSIDAATAPYFTRPELYERDRPLYRKYLPVVKAISEAGWTPDNRLLEVQGGQVVSEQFGDRYVTLFNPHDRELLLKVRFAGANVREMLSNAPVVRPREWTTMKLASESARVYEVR